MAPTIPDRWKDYKPVGEKIEGTRFVAFKVPLKELVSNNVDSDIRLDCNILLKTIPNLGLIIDLTNTHRYYDPNIFRREGVKHIKLMTPGHETPPKHLADEFNMIVKSFIECNADNDKLIGVHCTHGVNRTGYFICNYMISHLTIEPKEALERFSNARGHKIERNNYINSLFKLPETNVQNSTTNNCRERNPQNVYPNQDLQYINFRSQNNYGNGYDNYRRSPSPPPFYRRPAQRFDLCYRPPSLEVRGVGQLRRPTAKSYQPPRLRTDYYYKPPTHRSQPNRHLPRLSHNGNKPYDCNK